jgi:prefoldin alpha subunit
MNDEKVQEKYLIFQLLQQNLEALKQNQELVKKQLDEILMTAGVLRELGRIGKEEEIMIPLGGGCFGTGKITDNKNVTVDIGAGIMLSKDVESTISFLGAREKELEDASRHLIEEMNKIANKMNELGSEIQSMAGES